MTLVNAETGEKVTVAGTHPVAELFPMLEGTMADGVTPLIDRPETGQPVLSRCEVLAGAL